MKQNGSTSTVHGRHMLRLLTVTLPCSLGVGAAVRAVRAPWKLCALHGNEQSEYGGALSARPVFGAASTEERRNMGRARRTSRDTLRALRAMKPLLELSSSGLAHRKDEEFSAGGLASSTNWMWRESAERLGTEVRDAFRPREASTAVASTGVSGTAEGLRDRDSEGNFMRSPRPRMFNVEDGGEKPVLPEDDGDKLRFRMEECRPASDGSVVSWCEAGKCCSC